MGSDTIDDWIRKLGDDDGVVRLAAREALVELGAAAVPRLVDAYRVDDDRLQWEAAKALSQIGDPGGVDVLIEALEHDDSGVRWIGAKGLAATGRAAVGPLCEALRRPGDGNELTTWMRTGARRASRWLVDEDDSLEELLAPLIEALENTSSSAQIPMTATAILKRLAG